MFKEITVIGGAGHVGLAFGLICASRNIKVHLYDINSKSLNMIKNGKAPIVGGGNSKRSMSYVDNTCQALLLSIKSKKANPK